MSSESRGSWRIRCTNTRSCSARIGVAAAVAGLLAHACMPPAEPPRPSQEPARSSPAVSAAPKATPPDAPHPQAPDAARDTAQPIVDEPVAPGLAPLAAGDEFQLLPVEGYRDAVVALPLGITEKRPVLLALHGNYDRPEWQCMVWSELVKHQAFVVCPRGVPRTDAPKSEDRWTYGGIPGTLKESYAALAAARASYEGSVSPAPAMFTGFSLGAIYGVHVLGADAKKRAAFGAGQEPPFKYAVLIEGGYQGWYAGRAKQFRADGAVGVLFGCGQYACRSKSQGLLKLLARADLRASVAFGGNVGHTYDGKVAAAVAEQLPALLADDPVWAPVVGALTPQK